MATHHLGDEKKVKRHLWQRDHKISTNILHRSALTRKNHLGTKKIWRTLILCGEFLLKSIESIIEFHKFTVSMQMTTLNSPKIIKMFFLRGFFVASWAIIYTQIIAKSDLRSIIDRRIILWHFLCINNGAICSVWFRMFGLGFIAQENVCEISQYVISAHQSKRMSEWVDWMKWQNAINIELLPSLGSAGNLIRLTSFFLINWISIYKLLMMAAHTTVHLLALTIMQ